MGRSTVVVASELEWLALTSLHDLPHVITGVGIPAVYRTFLRQSVTGPLLSIGIAGAYPESGLAIGDVVLVGSDVVADLGMELPNQPYFSPLRDFPFGSSHHSIGLFAPIIDGVKVVDGCTVSMVTGTKQTGILRRDLYRAAIETMEGYALADIATTHGVKCIQIRAISNFASDRDMQPLNVRRALESLERFWDCNGKAILEALDEE